AKNTDPKRKLSTSCPGTKRCTSLPPTMKNTVVYASLLLVLGLISCTKTEDPAPGTNQMTGGTSPADPETPDASSGGTPSTDAEVPITLRDLGPHALICEPTMDPAARQAQIDAVAAAQESRDNEFGPNRYALLFKPGSYTLRVNAGF